MGGFFFYLQTEPDMLFDPVYVLCTKLSQPAAGYIFMKTKQNSALKLHCTDEEHLDFFHLVKKTSSPAFGKEMQAARAPRLRSVTFSYVTLVRVSVMWKNIIQLTLSSQVCWSCRFCCFEKGTCDQPELTRSATAEWKKPSGITWWRQKSLLFTSALRGNTTPLEPEWLLDLSFSSAHPENNNFWL